MTLVAIGRGLIFPGLGAGAAHDWLEVEDLFRDLADHLICPIGQDAGVPQRLALFCHQHRVADLQSHHGVEKCLAKRDVIGISQCLCQWKLGRRPMAGLALDILNFLLVAVNIAITHGLNAGMAVHAIEGVFAASEIGDGLIIVVKPVGGLIRPFDKGHRPQIVVAPVVAGIALSIGYCHGESVDSRQG